MQCRLVTVRPGPGCLGQARPRAACLQTSCSSSCACGPGPAGTRRCPFVASSFCAGPCQRVCVCRTSGIPRTAAGALGCRSTWNSCRGSQDACALFRRSRASRHGGQHGASAERAVCVRAGCCGQNGHRLAVAGPGAPLVLGAPPALDCIPVPARPRRPGPPCTCRPRARACCSRSLAPHTAAKTASAARTAGLRGGILGKSMRCNAAARPPRLGRSAMPPAWRATRLPGTCCAAAHVQAAPGHSTVRGAREAFLLW